jgi:DNA-binding NarL/FixJ family response regulator
MIRILIADDQELVRSGFRMIVEAEDDMEVVAEALDGADAIAQSRLTQPDVILMDVRMPGIDGLEATRRILSEQPPLPHVLMLTTFDADEYVHAALSAGADGFLLKSAPPTRLIEGIRSVVDGETMLAPSVTRRLIADYIERRSPGSLPPSGLNELTAREVEVLTLIAHGLSNAEIAIELVVSEATVKTHINRLFTKLGVRDRAQAVVLAYESGLVVPTVRPKTSPT